jgi:hypothetical protein
MNEDSSIPSIPVCSVCEEPIAGQTMADVELGPVCPECKIQLRWAHAWLNKLDTGIKGCTTKFNLRS